MTLRGLDSQCRLYRNISNYRKYSCLLFNNQSRGSDNRLDTRVEVS
jgi:hypothetical protein